MTSGPDPTNQTGQSAGPDHQNELQLWANWLQQLAAAGTDISRLLLLELRLAMGDSRRLLLLALLAMPVLLLAWIGVCVLLSWLIYQFSVSVTLALAGFILIQLAALAGIRAAVGYYRKSLRLPLTRKHLKSFTRGNSSESQTADQ